MFTKQKVCLNCSNLCLNILILDDILIFGKTDTSEPLQ